MLHFKLFSLIIFLIICMNSSWAQQNFFNIPSGQITASGKWFYQHQVNYFDTNNIASKQHFVFGAYKGGEVGINFVNYYPMKRAEKDKERDSGPLTNIFAPSYQHEFNLMDSLSLNFGGQYGFAHVGSKGGLEGTGLAYSLLTWSNNSLHIRVTGGAWVSDEKFNGPKTTKGFMLGAEWMFYPGAYIMGDWISGNTHNSVAVLGGMVDLAPGWQLCLGALLPNKDSKEEEGIVLELNVFSL